MIGIVSGVNGFLGRSLVSDLVKSNHKIIGIDYNLADESNKCCDYYQCDFRNEIELCATLKNIKQKYETIDFVINNSALKEQKLLCDYTITDINDYFRINVISPIIITKKMIEYFPDISHVINISSNAAFHGYNKGSLYCSTKSALLTFSQALQYETKTRIYALCPSTIQSQDLIEKHGNKKVKKFITYNVIKKEIIKILNKDENRTVVLLVRFKYRVKHILYYLKLFGRKK